MIGLYKEALSKKNPDMRAPYQYVGHGQDGRRVINHSSIKDVANLANERHVAHNIGQYMVGTGVIERAANKRLDMRSKRMLEMANRSHSDSNNEAKKSAVKDSEDARKGVEPALSSLHKPKLLSTRRRKALAAGGALAVAGLGAYAYKRHLDKKREEANGK